MRVTILWLTFQSAYYVCSLSRRYILRIYLYYFLCNYFRKTSSVETTVVYYFCDFFRYNYYWCAEETPTFFLVFSPSYIYPNTHWKHRKGNNNKNRRYGAAIKIFLTTRTASQRTDGRTNGHFQCSRGATGWKE